MSLLKNALLSVFVGKSGREALKAYEESRKLGSAAPLERRKDGSDDTPGAHQDIIVSNLAPTAPPSARPGGYVPHPQSPHPQSPHPQSQGHEALESALHRAKVNMARKANKAMKEHTNPGRQQLIANALQAHRDQRQVLDQLDDEARVKLTMMALSAFMGGSGTRH